MDRSWPEEFLREKNKMAPLGEGARGTRLTRITMNQWGHWERRERYT